MDLQLVTRCTILQTTPIHRTLFNRFLKDTTVDLKHVFMGMH